MQYTPKVRREETERFAQVWTQNGILIPFEAHHLQFATDYANVVLKNFVALCQQNAAAERAAQAEAEKDKQTPRIVLAS